MKKKVLCFIIISFFIGSIVFIRTNTEKTNEKHVLYVENIEMTLDKPHVIGFSVITGTGDIVTDDYLRDDTFFDIADESIISIENGTITGLKEGKTSVNMKIYHKEGPIKNKKEVVMNVLETNFTVIVMQ